MPRRKAEHYLPLAYFVAALLLTVAVLPSILHQLPPPQTQTAQLSPDAPPDDQQQSIIASLGQASSGTAGTGNGFGNDGVIDAGGLLAAPAPKRACRFGVGNPPRTSASPYAAPCVAVWSGNNGGATTKGVTGTEVRVAVGYPNGDAGTDGPVAVDPNDTDNATDRTWSVLQAWFNSHYEFYGRTLRLYVRNYGEDVEEQKTAAGAVDEEYHVFAASMGRWATMIELARRGIVAWGEDGDQYPESFLAARRPFNWEMNIDADRAVTLSAEYICKKLWNKTAAFAGDPTMQAGKRVLGVVYNNNTGYAGYERTLESELKAGCNAELAVKVGFTSDLYGFNDMEQVSTAVTKLRQAGVTTVVQLLDMDTMGFVTHQADAQAYNPEWFISGLWECDNVFFAKTFLNPRQWAHAFGISGRQIDVLATEEPGYRAYKEIDPAGEPAGPGVGTVFAGLEQIANGIQMAGPRLTPQTFEQGLARMGHRPADPIWAQAGGFGPDDHSWSDQVAEIWWSPTTASVSGAPGSYIYVRDGKRYGVGELPREDPMVFKEGTSSADLRRRGVTK